MHFLLHICYVFLPVYKHKRVKSADMVEIGMPSYTGLAVQPDLFLPSANPHSPSPNALCDQALRTSSTGYVAGSELAQEIGGAAARCCSTHSPCALGVTMAV